MLKLLSSDLHRPHGWLSRLPHIRVTQADVKKAIEHICDKLESPAERRAGRGWRASSAWSTVLNKGLFSKELVLTSTKAIWQRTQLLSQPPLCWLQGLLFAPLLNSEDDVSCPKGICFALLAYPPLQLSPEKSYLGQYTGRSSQLERWMLFVMDFENHSASLLEGDPPRWSSPSPSLSNSCIHSTNICQTPSTCQAPFNTIGEYWEWNRQGLSFMEQVNKYHDFRECLLHWRWPRR